MKEKKMIEINNASAKFRNIDKSFLKKIARSILLKEYPKKDIELSIVLVDSKTIRALNRKCRKKDKATDVLSFGSAKEELPEIVICPEEVEKNAKESFKKELAKVLIHGILHIMGYEHEKKESEAKIMFKKQEEYLLKLI